MKAEENRRIVLSALDGIRNNEWEAYTKDMAPEIEIWVIGSTPFSGTFIGAQAILEAVAYPASTQIETFGLEIEMVVASDEAVAVTAQGRMRLKNGKTYDNTYAYFFTLEDGKIVKLREYADTQMLIDTMDF